MVYLDYAATAPLLPEAKAAMTEATEILYGNASALHTPGHLAHEKIEETRELLAKLINADPTEIIFTSGSTESNNTVINTFRGQSIATSAIEHESILDAAQALTSVTTILKIDKNGKVCYNEKIGSNHPNLVSIILASNELGTIQPIQTFTNLAHQNNAYFHSDMTQALGKIPIDVKALDVDYATFSAHKIGGPIGVGALYIKKGAPFTPLMIGGSQEHYRRSGTYNTLGLIGFRAALEHILTRHTCQLYATKVRTLRDNLAHRILAEIPYSSLNSSLDDDTLPNILNVSFQAAEGESIQLYLDAAGIIVSTGSACAAGNGKPSHVLMAKTHDAEVAHSSVRFSFGLANTASDVALVMQELPPIIQKLQSISTIGVKNV